MMCMHVCLVADSVDNSW